MLIWVTFKLFRRLHRCCCVLKLIKSLSNDGAREKEKKARERQGQCWMMPNLHFGSFRVGLCICNQFHDVMRSTRCMFFSVYRSKVGYGDVRGSFRVNSWFCCSQTFISSVTKDQNEVIKCHPTAVLSNNINKSPNAFYHRTAYSHLCSEWFIQMTQFKSSDKTVASHDSLASFRLVCFCCINFCCYDELRIFVIRWRRLTTGDYQQKLSNWLLSLLVSLHKFLSCLHHAFAQFLLRKLN